MWCLTTYFLQKIPIRLTKECAVVISLKKVNETNNVENFISYLKRWNIALWKYMFRDVFHFVCEDWKVKCVHRIQVCGGPCLIWFNNYFDFLIQFKHVNVIVSYVVQVTPKWFIWKYMIWRSYKLYVKNIYKLNTKCFLI